MNADAYKYIRFQTAQETRWATVEEIHASCTHICLTDETYPVAGLPILSDGRDAYVDGADTHSLIFGATGSKKTRLFCMPMINMMAKAGESFIVTDPKGELYARTAGLAKSRGYRTVILNFRDIGTGDRWNPLSLPYEFWQAGQKDEAGMLLSDIATTIGRPLSNGSKDLYWSEAAQEMAIAGFYVLMEAAKKEEVNMKSFAGLSSQANIENIQRLTKMMREDSIAAINYNSTAGLKASVTSSGIIGVLQGMLRLFTVNEKLAWMMAETTFDMRRFGRERTAVYLIVPDEKTTYHFLVTMFLKQAYETLIAEAQKEKNRALPIRVNFVLDEFCNIPRVPDMPSMISAARSRNMRYFLVVQSLHQLKGRYEDDADTIKGNCDNWVFLTSKERDLLLEISELCGRVIMPDGRQRPLISTSELQRFNKEKGETLIMHARQYPIISALPDISQYEMFCAEEVAVPPAYTGETAACFSLSQFLRAVERHEVLPPFVSGAHMLWQAKSIYREELEKQKVENGERPGGMGISDLVRRMRMMEKEEEEKKDEEDPVKKEAEKAEKEKERKEKIRIAEEAARVRIAALLGEAYATRFFAEGLKDAEFDEDDPFDD